jgi:hypothetical protein
MSSGIHCYRENALVGRQITGAFGKKSILYNCAIQTEGNSNNCRISMWLRTRNALAIRIPPCVQPGKIERAVGPLPEPIPLVGEFAEVQTLFTFIVESLTNLPRPTNWPYNPASMGILILVNIAPMPILFPSLTAPAATFQCFGQIQFTDHISIILRVLFHICLKRNALTDTWHPGHDTYDRQGPLRSVAELGHQIVSSIRS